MRKEHYERHSITIPEHLAIQYGKMNKSAILLHQYILSIVGDEGAVKRNVRAASRSIGCSRRLLYDAETSLVVRGLLRRTSRSRTIFWKLVPTIQEEKEVKPAVISEAPVLEGLDCQDRVITMEKPRRRGFLSWLRRKKDER